MRKSLKAPHLKVKKTMIVFHLKINLGRKLTCSTETRALKTQQILENKRKSRYHGMIKS